MSFRDSQFFSSNNYPHEYKAAPVFYGRPILDRDFPYKLMNFNKLQVKKKIFVLNFLYKIVQPSTYLTL